MTSLTGNAYQTLSFARKGCMCKEVRREGLVDGGERKRVKELCSTQRHTVALKNLFDSGMNTDVSLICVILQSLE